MILPEDNDLGEIAQSDNFTIDFSITGLELEETIESIEVIPNDPIDGIDIDISSESATISGNYGEQFKPSPNSLSYVDTNTGELKSVDDWDELPDRSEAELTSWEAPEEITKTFTYTVIFNITGLSGSRQETKDYYHSVYGDYSVWSTQLRNYVGNS